MYKSTTCNTTLRSAQELQRLHHDLITRYALTIEVIGLGNGLDAARPGTSEPAFARVGNDGLIGDGKNSDYTCARG